MTVEPHWSAIVSALVIAIVAVFGAYIAWSLWKTNHDTLRERLFDRRYEIFRAMQNTVSIICAEKRISWEDANDFSEIAQRARFMFAPEDAQYFEELRRKALALAKATSEAETGRAAGTDTDAETAPDLCAWFDEQVEEIFLRMNKYLLFEK